MSSAVSLATQESELSHRDRFSPPAVRWERAEAEFTAALQTHPEDSKVLGERGAARLRLGKVDEAVADLRRAALLAPGSADLRANLSYGLWVQGRLLEALDTAWEALAVDSNHAAAHFYAGRILLQLGSDLPKAIEHLKRAVDLNPDDPDFRFDLLSAYRAAGDVIHAASQLRLLRRMSPLNSARVLYAEGLLSTDLGNLEVAVGRFRSALQLDAKLDAVRQDLGVALVQTSRWQEAAETLAPLAQSQPQSFAAAYFHALALQNLKRAEAAEAEARRAISLRPSSADAHALLGIILAGRGAHNDALTALTRAAQLDPKNFDAQFYLGRARYALRDLPGSRDAFRAALEIRPDETEARFFLATVLEAAGEKDPALAEYRELIARRPQDARGYIGLGAVLAKYGQVEEALAQLQRAREIAPQDFEAALAFGRLLVKEGRIEEGVLRLQEAVALAPHNAEAHYQLGLGLQRAGRSDEARREFAAVDRLNRERRSASNGMGQKPEEKP